MSRLDDARQRVRSLLSRAKADDTDLTGVDESTLEAELAVRVAAAKKHPPKPAEENPRSRYAGAAPGDAEARAKMGEARAAKVRGVRGKRAADRKAAEDEAFRRVKEQARRQPSNPYARSGRASSGPESGWRERVSSGIGNLGRDEELAGYYKILEVPYGSPRDEVKTAYRKLMRKYHPDLHNQSPKKQKAATELTMKVTQAYNGLEKHFKAK